MSFISFAVFFFQISLHCFPSFKFSKALEETDITTYSIFLKLLRWLFGVSVGRGHLLWIHNLFSDWCFLPILSCKVARWDDRHTQLHLRFVKCAFHDLLSQGPHLQILMTGVPTEVRILYPKKLQLQNLST